MGKDWTIDHDQGDEAYFYYFRAMENNDPKKLFKLSTALKKEEEQRNDVFIYKTVGYPSNSKPPKED